MTDTPRKTLTLPTKKTADHSNRSPVRNSPLNRKDKSRKKPVSPTATATHPSCSEQGPQSKTQTISPQNNRRPSEENTLIRLSKLMAEQGICSRREADHFIEQGWVLVDGQIVATLGAKVAPTAMIQLDKAAQALQKKRVTILLHKPVGYVSGQPEPGFKPAAMLIQRENQWRPNDSSYRFHPAHHQGLAPAGRLDIDSSGLLVFTQDGRIAKKLIGEDSTIDKEYLVRVEGKLDAKGLKLLNHGLSLDGKALKPAKVKWLNEDQLHFTLMEGKKRQIRRMCELVGLKVIGLKRVRIGKVILGDLPMGQWRYLLDEEEF